MKRETFKNNKAVGNVTIAVVAVLLVAGALGGAYLLSNDDDGTLYDDPVIQGDIGIGSTFTYSINGDAENTESLEMSGQSGSYYFFEPYYNDYNLMKVRIGFDSFLLHKTTGAMLFGDSAGKDSIKFDGKDIDLVNWKIEASGMVMVVSSGPDGVPYKISTSYISSTETNVATLIDRDIVTPAGDYVKSDVVGNMMEYSVVFNGPNGKSTGNGTLRFVCVAEKNDGYVMAVFFESKYSFGGVSSKGMMLSLIESELTLPGFVTDMLYSLEMSQSDVKMNTMDGEILCDKYADRYQTMYIGQENGIPYKIVGDMYFTNSLPSTATLTKYILNGTLEPFVPSADD